MTIDFKKTHRELYTAAAIPSFVDVPELPFLMVDGVGDPREPAYQVAVGALYGAAYRIRSVLKKAGMVYTVPPLQGLWGNAGDGLGDRSAWTWTMLLMQPPEVTGDMVGDAGAVRLARFQEGRSVQVLHIGPYHEETAAVGRLLDHVREHGCSATGRHHEIYLSNPARTAPDKLKTIIRYAVS
jgi:hypothetical protein